MFSLSKREKDKVYLEILRKLPPEALEELILYLEKETSTYLKQLLPPGVDYNVSISISRREKSVDVAIDVIIRGRLKEFSEDAKAAINYAKNKLIEWLEVNKEKYLENLEDQS